MTRKEIKKLDTLWSLKIRGKKGCEICGKQPTSAHHAFSRTAQSTRCDLDNGVNLCYRHHVHWAHKEPILFTEWFKKKLGKRFSVLKRKNAKPTKLNFETLLKSFMK